MGSSLLLNANVPNMIDEMRKVIGRPFVIKIQP